MTPESTFPTAPSDCYLTHANFRILDFQGAATRSENLTIVNREQQGCGMVGWNGFQRCGPLGVDSVAQSVKLLQLSADRTRVTDAARWDLVPPDPQNPEGHEEQLVRAILRAREGRRFRGQSAVFCLHGADLVVQNIRVAPASGEELRKLVLAEAAGRLPFPSSEAEVRFVEVGDVRQGEALRREVILLACHRPALERRVAQRSRLRPVAIDVEPSAILRCYSRLFRREQDQQQAMMFVNVGASNTLAVIARGAHPMFVKYIELGGRHLDQAVAQHLRMNLADAAALRRHNGDRRADQRDPEITRSIAESVRPVLDRLINELSMCVRYYSVTFRGQPLGRVVLGGGEANEALVERLAQRLDFPCELGDPLRSYEKPRGAGRASQWAVAAGLALRDDR